MKKLIFLLHVIITLAFTFMPLLFSWWVNIIIYVVWYLHYLVFGKCVLTLAEYGKTSQKEFGQELLKFLHINMSMKNYLIFVRYIQAPLCIALSLLWQKVFGFKPFLF